MSIIYTPKGKAYEYSPLAANLYSGCEHFCKYCYGPNATFKDRLLFHSSVAPRKNVIEQLKKEVKDYRGNKDPVLLCFVCDPYTPLEAKYGITRQVLELFRDNDIRYKILTKAGKLPQRDLDIMKTSKCEYGITLSWMDDTKRQDWEPHASSVADRIETLKMAKLAGILTWVSIEPVIDPEQALAVISELADCVDMFKVGKLNHMPEIEKTVDWKTFGNDAEFLLQSKGCNYYIKKDLREIMDEI